MNHFWTAPFVQRALVPLLLLGLLVALMMSAPVYHEIERLVLWGQGFIEQRPVTGLLLFLGFCALSAIAAFFSVGVLLPVAIQTWGQGLTFALVALGWLMGGVISYTIGRYPGRRLFQWLVPKKDAAPYEELLSKNQSFSFVLLFQLALPSEVPGYVLGALRYRFSLYLVGLVLAEVPWALGAVYLGASFLQGDPLWLFLIGSAGVLFMGSAMYLLRRKMKRLKAQQASPPA